MHVSRSSAQAKTGFILEKIHFGSIQSGQNTFEKLCYYRWKPLGLDASIDGFVKRGSSFRVCQEEGKNHGTYVRW